MNRDKSHEEHPAPAPATDKKLNEESTTYEAIKKLSKRFSGKVTERKLERGYRRVK